MPALSAIPDHLRPSAAGREFLRWLRSIPAPAPYKKAILFHWAEDNRHSVTNEEVLYIIPGGDQRTPQSPLIPIQFPDDIPPPDSIITRFWP